MAKLQGINYGRRASRPNTIGPNAAVRAYAQKGRILDSAIQLGGAVAQQVLEGEQHEANSAHRQALIDLETFIAEHPTATQEELDDLAIDMGMPGVFSSIDTAKFDARGEAELPSHVWRAAATDAVLSKSMSDNGEKISSPRARRAWQAATLQNNDQILSSVIERSGREALRYEFDRVSRETREAIDSRRIEEAKELLQSPLWKNDPTSRKLLQRELGVAEKMRDVETLLVQAEDQDDFDAIVDQVTGPDWGEGMASDDVLRVANSVVARRNAYLNQVAENQKRTQEIMATDMLAGLNQGIYSSQDVIQRSQVLGWKYTSALLSAARTVSDKGVSTDPVIRSAMTAEIMAMRSGITLFPGDERSFKERSADLTWQLIQEQAAGRVSPQDALSLQKEIESAVEFPYQTEEYRSLVGELRNRILGSPDEGFSFLATDESRADFANAVDNLRQYIMENGGAGADLSEWQRSRMPTYLNAAAKKALLNAPEGIDLVTNGVSVDIDATRAKIQDQIRAMNANPTAYTQDQVQEQLQKLDDLNYWFDREGKRYASPD